MKTLKGRGVELAQLRDTAAAQRAVVERQIALESQLKRYEQQRLHLEAMIEDLLGQPVVRDETKTLIATLRSELEVSERAIAEMAEESLAARTVISATNQAVRLLAGDHALCPTCVRPLDHRERESAITDHLARLKMRKQQRLAWMRLAWSDSPTPGNLEVARTT